MLSTSLAPNNGTAATELAFQVTFTIDLSKNTENLHDEVQKKLLKVVLEFCDGNKKKAAGILGTCLKTVYNLIDKHKLES